jgi:hypothetical protein
MVIDKRVRLISFGYILYVILFIIGASVHNKYLNLIGAACLFIIVFYRAVFLGFNTYKYEIILFIYVFILSLVISFILNYKNLDYIYFLKYLYLYAFVAMVLQLKLDPLYEKSIRIPFLVVIGFLIIYSLAFGETFDVEGEARFAGVFVNSNNLSLMSYCLLFFISSSDRLIFKVMLHALVVFLLIKSGTSGAFVSYLFGMTFLFREKYKIKYNNYLIILFVLIVIVFAFYIKKLYLVDRVFMQYQVITEGLSAVLSRENVDYYLLGEYYGYGALSGLWRLDHWLNILDIYFRQDFMNIVFGLGIGSTERIVKTLPHNDYLRILFESGVVGLCLIISLFVYFYNKIDNNYKYVFMIIVVFMVTENVIDNLLFMSLFFLWIGSIFQKSRKNTIYVINK